jgi:hypothetical protein
VVGETPIESVSNDLLIGRGAIARFLLGTDTPEAKRRVSALMHEIMPRERRIPFCLVGEKASSRKSWILEYLRRNAENLPAA